MIAQRETAELDDLLAEVSEKSGDYKELLLSITCCPVGPSENNIFDLASFLLQHPNTKASWTRT